MPNLNGILTTENTTTLGSGKKRICRCCIRIMAGVRIRVRDR